MNTFRYAWGAGDTWVGVAGAKLASSNYDDVYTLMADMYTVNPTILDPYAIAPGTVILIPYKTS